MGAVSSTEHKTPQENVAPKDIISETPKFNVNTNSTQDYIAQATILFNKGNYEQCYQCLKSNNVPVLDYIQVETLQQMVLSAADNAQRGVDALIVFRLCKIDIAIQSIKRGSTCLEAPLSFTEYLLQQVHVEGLRSMRRLMEADDGEEGSAVAIATISGLGALYSKVGEYIHDYKSLVSEEFGAVNADSLLFALYGKAINHAGSMIEFFIESYSLPDIMQQLQDSTENTRPDPLQLDELLQTIVLACSYSVRFINFMASMATTNSIDPTLFMGHIKLILGYYLGLEEQYMLGAITAAVEQSSTSDNQSTCVDDSFFVLRKCTRRALSSLDANTSCAVITAGRGVLDSALIAVYTRRISESIPNSDIFIVGLNDLALMVQYMVKLKRDLESDIGRLYNDEAQQKKLIDCANHLTSPNTMSALLKTYSEQYAASLLPLIDHMIPSYATLSYELDEVAYEQAEINDPFVSKFIESLNSIFSPLSVKLSQHNLIVVADQVAKYIASQLEHLCFMKKYTILGAVQFAKDIRVLSGYFISIGREGDATAAQALRHRFSRLGQIAQLLNLDRVIDVMEYWAEGKSVFKLTTEEVKKALSRRVDFSVESIAMLKLS